VPNWVAPPTFAPNTLVTVTDMNTISDDLRVLKDPTSVRTANIGGYTGTTSTTFTDIGALSFTLVTNGGPLLICMFASATFAYSNPMNTGYFDINLDTVRVGGTEGILVVKPYSADQATPVSFAYLTGALSAGTHTVKLQYRVANSSTSMQLYPLHSFVREVS
jgi:hypothetical protein